MGNAEAIAEAGRQISKCMYSAKQAEAAFMKLSKALAKVTLPPLEEIRRLRIDRMKEDHGIFRFMMPEYYTWLMMK